MSFGESLTYKLILIFLVFFSCEVEKPLSSNMFQQVPTSETGIDFRNDLPYDLFTNYNVLAHQFFYRGAGVAVGDINGDGLQDVLFTANMQQNRLYLNEGNWKFKDITKDYKGRKVPLRGRECSSEQMPFIKEKFPTFAGFANASIDDILGEENVKSAEHLICHTFQSTVFINDGGKFVAKPLEPIAQSFPVHAIQMLDLNNDSHLDMILAGNLYNMEVETARLDAGNGLVLIGDGTADFKALTSVESGLFLEGECKSILNLRSKSNKSLLVFPVNNEAVSIYTINNN